MSPMPGKNQHPVPRDRTARRDALRVTYFAFFWPPRESWMTEIGGTWWTRSQLSVAWPAYLRHGRLLSGLVAATLVDARTF